MKTYIIKIWETEELRDLGESDIVEIDLDSLKKAISRAKEIMEEQNYASLEVQDSEETESYYFCTPKEEEYLYDDKALEKYRKTHSGNFTLQRYKGLGEMDADQLWETTLNPETRMMKRIEIEDGKMASDITALLMGNEVPPRKAYIYEHANDAQLDI